MKAIIVKNQRNKRNTVRSTHRFVRRLVQHVRRYIHAKNKKKREDAKKRGKEEDNMVKNDLIHKSRGRNSKIKLKTISKQKGDDSGGGNGH